MATYAELLLASEDETLRNKVRVALFIAAENVRSDASPPGNQAARLVWAKSVFTTGGDVSAMMRALLAQNSAASLATILAASDATVLTAVEAAIDVFV
jgi:hypothetical protein